MMANELNAQIESNSMDSLLAASSLRPLLTLAVRGRKPEEIFSVDTNYDDLVKDIKVGDVVLVDNGVIQMAVKDKSDFLLKCEVLTPGSLGSRRHINLPGVKVNLPAITEKDWDDIRFGLESMIQNPLPTRAEITDVANAVYEQADAIMLSGETSVGRYPLQCVEVLDRVARRMEFSGNIGFQTQITLASERDNLVASAIHLAEQTKAGGIAVFTRQGYLASLCAALRSRWSSVFAFTASSHRSAAAMKPPCPFFSRDALRHSGSRGGNGRGTHDAFAMMNQRKTAFRAARSGPTQSISSRSRSIEAAPKLETA